MLPQGKLSFSRLILRASTRSFSLQYSKEYRFASLFQIMAKCSLASQIPIRLYGEKRGLVTPRTTTCMSAMQLMTYSSLASHTLQSQEKEGLVTSRTQSCTRSRILEQPITFEILKCAVLPVATRRVMRRRFITQLRMNVPLRKERWSHARCRKEPDVSTG